MRGAHARAVPHMATVTGFRRDPAPIAHDRVRISDPGSPIVQIGHALFAQILEVVYVLSILLTLFLLWRRVAHARASRAVENKRLKLL